MTLEQTPEQFQEARTFGANAQLRTVRLAKSKSWSRRLSEELGENVESEITIAYTDPAPSQGEITLPVQLNFRMVEKQDDTQSEIIGIEAEFEADYALRPGYEATKSQVAAFHMSNAVHNCWPFFREFVQSLSVRMGYPAPPVPLLRLAIKPVQARSARRVPPTKKKLA